MYKGRWIFFLKSQKVYKVVCVLKYQFGCGISNMVAPKKQDFWPRINIPYFRKQFPWKLFFFEFGIILENKTVQKLKLKNNVLPKMI